MIVYPDSPSNMADAISGDGSEYDSEGEPAPDKVLSVGDGHIACADNGWSRNSKLEVRVSSYANEAAVYPSAERHRRFERKIVLGSKCGKIARLVQ